MDIKEIIAKSDYIVTFGTFLARDNEEIQEAIIKAIAKNDAEFIYMHPIDNIDLKMYYTQFLKYEVGSEEGICSLLLDTFVKDGDEDIKTYIDDLDIGYISAESSAGEEEFEELLQRAKDKKEKTLIIGRDLFSHERVENITKILSVIKKYSDLNIISLDPKFQKILDEASSENLEQIQDIHSYNGTVIYRVYEEDDNTSLIGSESFARVAKISNQDDIYINCNNQKIQRKFKIDKNLMGTVALCPMSRDDSSCLSEGYRYKQVKIEKVDA